MDYSTHGVPITPDGTLLFAAQFPSLQVKRICMDPPEWEARIGFAQHSINVSHEGSPIAWPKDANCRAVGRTPVEAIDLLWGALNSEDGYAHWRKES